MLKHKLVKHNIVPTIINIIGIVYKIIIIYRYLTYKVIIELKDPENL